MNKKTLGLIIFLALLAGSLFILKYVILKNRGVSPVLPPASPTPRQVNSPTPPKKITPFPTLILTGKPTLAPSEKPLPTFISQPTLAPTTNPLLKEKIINFLPIVTDGYLIEYLSTSRKFFVTIVQAPVEENRQKAENWFQSYGVNPKDPDIIWNVTRALNPKTEY